MNRPVATADEKKVENDAPPPGDEGRARPPGDLMHRIEDTLRLGEPLGRARGAVILIHGRGSSPHDIADLADVMSGESLAFLVPAAEGGTLYPERFLVPPERNEPWLSGALNLLDRLRAEAESAGLGRERIALVGFSQGGCLALEFAARHPGRYGFVAGLSGALIGPLETPRPAGDLHATPVLLGCAERDAHIPVAYVERSAAVFSRLGAEVTKRIFPGSAHTIFPEEIEWLKARASMAAAEE
jgi:phospholipase/carboxylesterase